MQFTINSSVLCEALNRLREAFVSAEADSHDCVHLKTQNDVLNIQYKTGSLNEKGEFSYGASTKLLADTLAAGEVTLDATELCDLLLATPGPQPIQFTKQHNQVAIDVQKGVFYLEDKRGKFIALERVLETATSYTSLHFKENTLLHSLQTTLKILDSRSLDSEYILIRFEYGQVSFLGDYHLLSAVVCRHGHSNSKEAEFILPVPVAQALVTLWQWGMGATFHHTKDHFVFSFGNHVVSTERVANEDLYYHKKFKDYQPFLDREHTTRIIIFRGDLLCVLKMAQAIACQTVFFRFAEELVITDRLKSPDLSMKVSFHWDKYEDGKDWIMKVDVSMLMRIISAFEAEEVQLSFSSAVADFQCQSIGHKESKAVLAVGSFQESPSQVQTLDPY